MLSNRVSWRHDNFLGTDYMGKKQEIGKKMGGWGKLGIGRALEVNTPTDNQGTQET